MVIEGTLNGHLKEIQETATSRIEEIIKPKDDLINDLYQDNLILQFVFQESWIH